MSHVFISYARKDSDRVDALVSILNEAGFSVWMDRQNLGAGKRFFLEIESALHSAACVLVCWSEHALNSTFVYEEARYAAENDKLLPVRFDDVSPPLGLRSVQHVDLLNWDLTTDQTPRVKTLINEVRRILGENNQKRGSSENAVQLRDERTETQLAPRLTPAVTTDAGQWSAHRFIKEAQEIDSLEVFARNLPALEGVRPPETRAIAAMVASGDLTPGLAPAVRDYIRQWTELRDLEDSGLPQAYGNILELWGESVLTQSAVARLSGEWTSYRPSNVKGKFIRGNYKFSHKFRVGLFEHRSVQDVADGQVRLSKNFNHRGLVYLLGLGPGYMRPEILRALDDAGRNVLLGVLATERFEHNYMHTPLASKTLLIRNGFADADEYLKNIDTVLASASSIDGILYGVRAEKVQFDDRGSG
jgi:hypothetical protein